MAQIDYSRSGTGEYSKYKDAFKYAPGSAAAKQWLVIALIQLLQKED